MLEEEVNEVNEEEEEDNNMEPNTDDEDTD